MIQIRPTIPDQDVVRICEIQNQFDPEPLDPKSYIKRMKDKPEGWVWVRISAEQDGELNGFAFARRSSVAPEGSFMLTVAVDERAQGQGIGKELFAAVHSEVKTLGGTQLVALLRETHPRARKFFADRGFRLAMSLRESWLELASVPEKSVPIPDGYNLLRWSELEDSPENRERFFQMYLRMDADEPTGQLIGLNDRAMVERTTFDPESTDPELLFILEHNGEWVAHHQLVQIVDGDWTEATIPFTGTLPEYRRRGLAKMLKELGVQEVRKKGTKRLLTNNNSLNAPMIAINEKQGFKDEPGWQLMVHEL